MNVLNTLFVLTPGAYVAKEGRNLLVRVNGEERIRVPVHGLSSVVCFGHTMVSPAAMEIGASAGVLISFFSRTGRFLARVEGAGRGSLLLRRAQLRATEDAEAIVRVARSVVVGKISNCRQVLLRRAREAADDEAERALGTAADHMSRLLPSALRASGIDEIRGYEGEAAATYFSVLERCLAVDGFSFSRRTRRPPRDPINALLSFAYAILANDCVAALAGVGLDPDAGFLHRDRPGRPSLALDLMEELRPALADRLVVALVNRRQVRPGDFVEHPTGGVSMSDAARRKFLEAYQARKQEEVSHSFLGRTVPWGLVPHLQARLFARVVRGDLESYPPFALR